MIKSLYYLVPLSLFVSFFSQTTDYKATEILTAETYGVLYKATIQPYQDRQKTRQFYQVVYSKGDSTITQTYTQRKLDSIASLRKPTAEERNTYYSLQTFVIQIHKNNLTLSEKVAENRHIYEEKLNHNWKLSNEIKTISGYECKKATLVYGGRNWTAWYAPSMPINAGPYKFKGLPGLIIKMTDADGLFDFEMTLVQKTGDRRMLPFAELNSEFEDLITTQMKFNSFKQTYESLSLNESINYLNRDKPGTVQLMITNTDGTPMNDINKDQKTRYNFMEVIAK
jgi:GLPGLI family protein